MTLIELLKQIFNATDDQITSVTDGMKANKIFTSAEENIDIRYGKLKGQHDTLKGQYDTMSKDYETLKQSAGDSAELLKQAAEKDATIAALQKEVAQAKIDGEVQVKLLSAGVKPDDIDYVMFKLKAKGDLEMGEDGKVKGLDEKVDALKTQLPANFASDGKKVFLERKLPTGEPGGATVTKEEFDKMGYTSRVNLKQENPELYDQMMKG